MEETIQTPPRVRLAPSPTGPFHWGTARTAVFNWLFARKHGGSFIVRIEDTDKERSKKKFERDIFDGLKWLGLNWDEGSLNPETLADGHIGSYGPYRQSERTEIYKKYLLYLLEEGKAYYCYCTKDELEAERQGMLASGIAPKYSGHCRNLEKPPVNRVPQVIRFRTPEVEVKFKDIIKGSISFNTGLFGDFVIAKNIENPLFNFAVVVDDYLMRISHVIRGEDHTSNTPKQILLARALNFKEPLYAHLPLVLGNSREKLSKRYLDYSLNEYKTKGYIPEAIINFISFIGWHPKDNNEILRPEEIIDKFELKRVQKGGAIFNEEKLLWFNAKHLCRLDTTDLISRLKNMPEIKSLPNIADETMYRLVELEKPRLKTLNDFFESTAFFFSLEDYSADLLIGRTQTASGALKVIKEIKDIVAESLGDFEKTVFMSKINVLIEKWGKGEVLWPLRVALSGRASSPDPIDIMGILKREEILHRLELAIKKLNELE